MDTADDRKDAQRLIFFGIKSFLVPLSESDSASLPGEWPLRCPTKSADLNQFVFDRREIDHQVGRQSLEFVLQQFDCQTFRQPKLCPG